ncbi:hypothetical protein O9929_20610 [Vibrio lentus]|nr:hypothetical protein [Vibrio lentus]
MLEKLSVNNGFDIHVTGRKPPGKSPDPAGSSRNSTAKPFDLIIVGVLNSVGSIRNEPHHHLIGCSDGFESS